MMMLLLFLLLSMMPTFDFFIAKDKKDSQVLACRASSVEQV
jgi:hypothetical protein